MTMSTEIIGVIAMYLITVLLAIPLGRYIGKTYMGEPTWADRIFNPIDKLFTGSVASVLKGR